MWTRAGIKANAKKVLKLNYWKAVLVGLLILLIGDLVSGDRLYNAARIDFDKIISCENTSQFSDALKEEIEDSQVNIGSVITIIIDKLMLKREFSRETIVWFTFVALLAYAIFIRIPFSVGSRGFFYKSLSRRAGINDAFAIFNNGYANSIKITLLMFLKVFLWSMLFIIPGIIKAYEYRMIPYIVAENPDISSREAFRETRRLMRGNKFDTFILDLSFIGWLLLSLLTCGMLSIFFVTPYKHYTYASLYQELKYSHSDYIDVEGYESREALFHDV